jgi:molybdopterin-synthase adenylyltransferase
MGVPRVGARRGIRHAHRSTRERVTVKAPTLLRPRLKPSLEVLPGGDGRIYVLHPTGSDVALDESEVASALIELLDGTLTRRDVVQELRARDIEIEDEQIDAALESLQELGLVEDGADDDHLSAQTLARFDRQLRYFADVGNGAVKRSECQRRLRASHVVVLGLGGLGSWAAYALACTGIGRLDLVDGDLVETSNLNRQILYRPADVGSSKAEVAADVLSAFDPEVEIRSRPTRLDSEDEVRDVVAGADFVIDAADWPPHVIERWINRACFETGLPYVAMGQFPPVLRLGPTYIPGETGCYACHEAVLRERFPLYDALAEARSRQPSPAATFGPACGIIGAHAALEAVHHLTGVCTPATAGTALLLDVRSMRVTREPIVRQADCVVCG